VLNLLIRNCHIVQITEQGGARLRAVVMTYKLTESGERKAVCTIAVHSS